MHRRNKELYSYINKNISRKTPEQMAQEMKMEVLQLKRFLHRYKMVSDKNQRNLAYRIIKAKFIHPEYFCPTRKFFIETGIGQRRWGLLFTGREKMSGDEFKRVVEHLKLDKRELNSTLNLELFNDDIH